MPAENVKYIFAYSIYRTVKICQISEMSVFLLSKTANSVDEAKLAHNDELPQQTTNIFFSSSLNKLKYFLFICLSIDIREQTLLFLPHHRGVNCLYAYVLLLCSLVYVVLHCYTPNIGSLGKKKQKDI